jgi:hypothetical protein
LWLVRKYVEFGNVNNVIFELPEEYRPILDTKEEESGKGKIRQYDVTIVDLIESGYLSPNETIIMSHHC